jgi:hypothetical protein
VLAITCQFSTSARLYNASLAALIVGGCKKDSGSSISKIRAFSAVSSFVLPFFIFPISASAEIEAQRKER